MVLLVAAAVRSEAKARRLLPRKCTSHFHSTSFSRLPLHRTCNHAVLFTDGEIVKMNRFSLLVPLLLAMMATACARSAGPLPGDSVSADGGSITLSPPRLSTSPTEAREVKEGLGPVESRLYPPELVMEHQAELGITPDQKNTIINETDRGQSEMVRLQWDLQAEKEKLVKILDGDHLDEQKVQDIAKQVMDRESKVKASHLGMLVRIKNILTSEQITKLRAIRTSATSPATTTTSSSSPPKPPSLLPTPTTSATQPKPVPHPKPSAPSPKGPDVF